MPLPIFLLGVGCLLEGFKAPILHHNLGSQEFNSDAESHFQRCYICIILHLRILVAQINQISLCLCTNKNQLPFPRPPSSSYNHSFSSGSFSNLPTLHLMLRNDLGSVAILLRPGLCASLKNTKLSCGGGKGQEPQSQETGFKFYFCTIRSLVINVFCLASCNSFLICPLVLSPTFFPYNGQTNNSKQFAFFFN